MFGITGTSPHIWRVRRSSGRNTSGTSGEGGEGIAESSDSTETARAMARAAGVVLPWSWVVLIAINSVRMSRARDWSGVRAGPWARPGVVTRSRHPRVRRATYPAVECTRTRLPRPRRWENILI
jgi:hypothetical protein